MDRIFITALTAETVIGIYDWEREVKQRLEIDLEIWMDLRAAATSDAIEDTLNYKSVAKRVLAFVEASQYPARRGARRRDRAHRARGIQGRRACASRCTSRARSAIRATSASIDRARRRWLIAPTWLTLMSRPAATSGRARACVRALRPDRAASSRDCGPRAPTRTRPSASQGDDFINLVVVFPADLPTEDAARPPEGHRA